MQVPQNKLIEVIQKPNENKENFCTWYLAHQTMKLDGPGRISLINTQAGGDLLTAPVNSLQVLFRDDSKREKVRRIIYDAFGYYLVIDPTNSGNLRIRLSKTPPASPSEERSLAIPAINFYSKAVPIQETRDGVKAFTGIICEIVAGDPNILIIDEANAFLSEPQAANLGKEIARNSMESHKRIFVASHSPSFLMGCIQSGKPINIVRLTYRNDIATARILPNNELLRLMRKPLLRSTNILQALFYEYVIVTESDTDRAFYQEINERLLQFMPEWGIPNCLFINAQNKQTVHEILRPLRHLGIPTAGIVDIDILKEGGKVWTTFLKGGFIPDAEHEPLASNHQIIKKKLENTNRDMKKEGGVELLGESDKEAANNLFDKLDQYGLFVVRHGEVESWLQHLKVSGHGTEWLVNIFENMGEDPDDKKYLKPDNNDVWKFILQIRTWLINKDRKGIPN